jgi:hypothetical protein
MPIALRIYGSHRGAVMPIGAPYLRVSQRSSDANRRSVSTGLAEEQ